MRGDGIIMASGLKLCNRDPKFKKNFSKFYFKIRKLNDC